MSNKPISPFERKGEVSIDFKEKFVLINKTMFAFQSGAEAFALILPENLKHKDFLDLEQEYLANKFALLNFVPLQIYCRNNKIKRDAAYKRAEKGKIQIIRDGVFTFVQEKEE